MEMNQVTLPVNNMEEAVKFYLALGFVQIVDAPHYARFSCPKGNSTFSLSLQSEEFKNGAIIYFETDELEKLVESLVEKGIQFMQLPTEQRYLWKEAVLKDSSGNKIKLFWAGENRLSPPWKVNKSG
ncbi:VOC family protein [Simiduia sp. 21SJ11W-1]|uniref:VOC family protein n=1 Tax=Simiduia sp. 21SJ11W-1 TaxID=2909669 RepID=UPI00209DD63B|nr:VOC family protein [Simiduia sp. 21SJ11W-1]UTA48264.1 VOC family protein [Simiduia sp. 21SJ11W-1]